MFRGGSLWPRFSSLGFREAKRRVVRFGSFLDHLRYEGSVFIQGPHEGSGILSTFDILTRSPNGT